MIDSSVLAAKAVKKLQLKLRKVILINAKGLKAARILSNTNKSKLTILIRRKICFKIVNTLYKQKERILKP